MLYRYARIARACLFVGSIVSVATRTWATGVPIDGFLPMVGITLTDQFVEDVDFSPYAATSLGGSVLSATTTPYYDVALLDTGAAISLLTAGADAAFDLAGPYPGEPDGYRGTEFIQIGGATGLLDARVSDPLGLYAAGLQARSGAGASLSMNPTALLGQTNTSVATLPAESPLPNILGLSFASQYATRIRNSLPQVFELGGKTVRTPAVDFQPLGTGHTLGITRKAPMSIEGSMPSTPIYQLNFLGVLNGEDSWENPSAPTLVQGGHFLNVNASNNGNALGTQQFFFDTGASVTVLSELTALQLGIDVQLDEPDFTIEVSGSGGGSGAVPGYYLDQFTVLATGGNLTLTNIPVLVFDVTNPASPGNVVPGIVGTNVFAGRDIVIDPNPSLGGGGNSAGVYISDPVTTDANWLNASASQPWFGSGQNWSGGALPGSLNVVNVRHIAGAAQRVILSVSRQVWEVNVSGASANQTMELSVRGVAGGATLTTFAGLNIEQFGSVELNGSAIDVQYIDIRDGGRLRGTGSIATGSGPIAGQVENSSGIVSPDQRGMAGVSFGAISIAGRFSNGALGVLEMELGGTTVTQYDRLLVDGTAALAGTLRVLLSGGYVPSLGAQFTLLTTTEGLGGRFDATELPALAADRMWFVGYGADSLLLKVTLPGDFDGNGSVDGADLAVWKTGYGTMYTGADFVLWQRHLGSGTPAATVPEPAAAVLLCVGAAGLKRRRQP